MGLQLLGQSKFRKQVNTYSGHRHEPTAELSPEEKIRPYILPQTRQRKELLEVYYKAASKLASLLEAHGISEDNIIADFQRERQRKHLS